jgi:hypothetical protein
VKSLWVLTAALLALALAGCGPDCDGYCRKIAQCQRELNVPAAQQTDVARCTLGCNDSGADNADTIGCYIDHTCPDIAAGHCSVTGVVPRAPAPPVPVGG